MRASDPLVPIGRTVREPGLHNLPQPLTSFVGRQREIAEASRLLRTTRLLTLTGTGGVGKTRLGHEIAASTVGLFEDGVWLVELAAMAHPGLLPDAVASVLGVRGDPKRQATAALIDAIRPKRLLLLLDNCEHLVDACAELADLLLGGCPSLWILATSRQPLGIAGETTLRVPSLTLSPGFEGPSSPVVGGSGVRSRIDELPATPTRCETPAMSEAARLFAARAQAVAPAFSLSGCNAAVVEQICERLDGIPLAIELAAARVAVLSLDQIADRLSDRLRLLTSGSRTSLPRYRTLRSLIDWSHDLLDEGERVLFRRLAVFAGGWTLEAAEAVCADPSAGSKNDGAPPLRGIPVSGQAIAPDEVLDLLSGLVTKSLVLVDGHDGEARYRFLETLREYAVERLGVAGEDTTVRERHRDWYLALAEQAEPELVGPHQSAWLDRLDRDRENLRAIMRRATAQGDPETLVRLGAALWRFWHERADVADAREVIAGVAPLAHRLAPSPALARALHGAGALAGALTEYGTSRSLFTDGLAVSRELDDRRAIATILDSLGRQLFVEARYAEARALLSQGVAILRELDDRNGLARALSHLGFLEYLEDRQDVARAIYREGLELARAAGDQGEVAEFLDNLGRTHQAAGDLDDAARAYEEAVAIWREGGHANWLAMGLNNLGGVEALRGEHGPARAHLWEALDLAWRIGNRRRQAFTLAAIATLAAVGGRAEWAVRLDAAASAAVAGMGATLRQPAYVHFAPHLARARYELGPTATEVATEAGGQTPLEQAVQETLSWLSEPDGDADPYARPVRAVLHALDDAPISPAASGTGGLSPRELEVAALVARGLTNRRIAEELVITEGTAASHVKHILAKLVLDSRVQIVAWAIEHGLPPHDGS